MTPYEANHYFETLPEGFAPAEELRAALPAAVQQVQFVGVAGTAGKTATAGLLGAILQAAGFVTGLYHAGCEPLAARIRVQGAPVDEVLFREAAEKLSAAKPLPRAAAELAAAAICFGAAGCKLAVVELPDAGLASALPQMPVCAVTAIGPDGVSRSVERLAALAAGETDAMEPLYRIANPAVYAFALSILKSAQDAEDVAQDCFVRIFQAAPDYRPMGKPMAWILTIARNLCLQKLRQAKRSAAVPFEDWETFLGAAPGDEADRLILDQFIRELDETERQLVVLHAVAGLKHREIAALLNLPLATALSRYHRALKKLRAKWEVEAS